MNLRTASHADDLSKYRHQVDLMWFDTQIHTDARNILAPDTLAAFLQLIQVKMNCDECCHDFHVTATMHKRAKACTEEYNKEHQ